MTALQRLANDSPPLASQFIENCVPPKSVKFVGPISVLLFALTLPAFAFAQNEAATATDVTTTIDAAQDAQDADGWKAMTGHWRECRFGGDGAVDLSVKMAETGYDTDPDPKKVDADVIRLGIGDPITGVRWTGPMPTENYEVRLQARRLEGFDFFCAVTFPVADEHCSLVLGGWGGGVVGISSIDGQDASENETTLFQLFKNEVWVSIRLRVSATHITAWIDDVEVITVERANHQFDIRFEMDPALPFGLANYQCISELKAIEIREFKP